MQKMRGIIQKMPQNLRRLVWRADTETRKRSYMPT